MKYDFTTIIDRAGKDAFALDAVGTGNGTPDAPKDGFDVIPMWVADMNFATCPAIQESIVRRVSHPCFGYFSKTDAYFDSTIRWQKTRNGVTVPREALGYENGVIGCISSAMRSFTTPGEPVLVHSPTYVGFTKIIENCGRRIVKSPLVRDEQGVWRMDYENMRQLIRENNIHFAVFCNPHNPCGRVWEPEEIRKAMEVYRENNVIVFSDEIWSDIILEGHRHTPTQSVSEDAKNRTIAVYALSKSFNLAGMVSAYHIIYNSMLRDRVTWQGDITHYNSMNVLCMHAQIAAYSPDGEQWINELCETLSGTIRYAYEYIRSHFKGVVTSMPEGTYMMYLECDDWCREHGKTMDELLKAGWDVGVGWQDGRPFFRPCGIRLNLALPRSRVEEAMDRLDRYVFNA